MVTAHSEERKFSCSHCDLKFKISAVLTRHIKRVHKKELNWVYYRVILYIVSTREDTRLGKVVSKFELYQFKTLKVLPKSKMTVITQ